MWVYVRTEPNLLTVGFFSPDGELHTDSDHGSKEEAAERVHYLNGGSKVVEKVIEKVIEKMEHMQDELDILQKHQANMLDAEGMPLPKWQAYFAELDRLNVSERDLLGPGGYDIG